MTWGTSSWGTDSWGGPSEEHGGATGGAVTISSVRFITTYLIRLQLDTHVIVNASYKNSNNYSISPHVSGTGTWEVRPTRVLLPADGSTTVDYVFLETTEHMLGQAYEISFASLSTLDGVGSVPSGRTPYSARTTKTMIALKSLPKHFDKRPDALIFNVIAAISLQDDDIGGSRNDEFP